MSLTQQDLGTDEREYAHFAIDNVVLDAYGLKAMELALYVAIVRFANRKTRQSFPSFDVLAERAGMAKRSIPRHLETLEGKGLIRIERMDGKVNHYVVLNPHTRLTSATESPVPPTGATESSVPPTGARESLVLPTSATESPVGRGVPVPQSHRTSATESTPMPESHPNNKAVVVVDSESPDSDDPQQQAPARPYWTSLALTLIQDEWRGMGLAGDLKDKLFALEAERALALVYHTKAHATSSPGGFLRRMVEGGGDPMATYLDKARRRLAGEAPVEACEANGWDPRGVGYPDAAGEQIEPDPPAPPVHPETLDTLAPGRLGVTWRVLCTYVWSQMQFRMNPNTFATWVRDAKPLEVQDGPRLVVAVRAENMALFWRERLQSMVEELFLAETGQAVTLEYRVNRPFWTKRANGRSRSGMPALVRDDLPRRQREFLEAAAGGRPVVKNAATRRALVDRGLIEPTQAWDGIVITPAGRAALQAGQPAGAGA